jgi:hypothetical protein
MDLQDTNKTRRKPNKTKKAIYVLLGDLKYKAPKIGVELELLNTKTSSIFIQF